MEIEVFPYKVEDCIQYMKPMVFSLVTLYKYISKSALPFL